MLKGHSWLSQDSGCNPGAGEEGWGGDGGGDKSLVRRLR